MFCVDCVDKISIEQSGVDGGEVVCIAQPMRERERESKKVY